MIETVIANTMSLRDGACGDTAISGNTFTKDEESRGDAMRGKDVEHFWGVDRMRTVVESQMNFFRHRFYHHH
ncbi:hypothetical protein XAXN_00630 [Xanthomonas axonopodis]|uniref:Uncharacterized protein n=1 Tax=Xanthomonas axonopodis TaxID=53413 RepID=A0A0P6W8H6_9XANT|nr:hypothetical protein XAXN_00630 [Xanthomonas axonopodis]